MFDKKEKIKKIVERYKRLTGKDIRGFNEEQTKNDFIRPLFEALGWDFLTDVGLEKEIQGKRADYAFMLNGNTKFLVEAKPLRIDLDIEVHAKQAIKYAWNKGINWAVLTDFESVKVFNAQTDSKILLDKLVFEIPYNKYISDFERLWLLSKDSFDNNALDEYAVKYGKKLKKLTVNDKLFNDLKIIREELTSGFTLWNENLDQEILEEGIQRIIERLMFIRVLEDKGLEDPVLIPILRQWEENHNEQLFPKLISKFRELDDIYNSNIFKKHTCEDWEEYGVKWNKIFNLLHGSNVYEYDFKEIPADVLGGVYESYLSYIAQNPIEIKIDKKSKKLFEVEGKKELKAKSRKKRKEQGIFYTPHFIVDYIVKNTVGQKLNEVKSIHELKQIKILDPACGSGSFLTRTLKAVNEKYIDFSNPGGQATKSEILLSNIYGVDLDSKAVELAKLNLLVEALDKKGKLPDLTENVRVGNSLISGHEKELKKYFGDNWQDKKPFNWEEEFPSICHSRESGDLGFDVIIGNPPYLSTEKGLINEVEYFKEKYQTMEKIYDIFGLFIEKSFNLLKEGGYIGFIIPNTILQNDSFSKLRKYILNNSQIICIDNYKDGVFNKVVVPTTIIILRKNKNNKDNKTKINLYENNKLIKNVLIKQSIFLEQAFCRFNISMDKNFDKIKRKIFENSFKLNEILKIQEAIKTGNDNNFISDEPEENFKNQKILLKGRDIERYLIISERYINYDIDNLKRPGKEEVFKLPEKLYIRRISNKIISVLDDKQRYAVHTLYTGVLINKNYFYKFVLALLNSSLFTYLYSNLYPFKGNIFPEIRIGNLGELPVKKIKKIEQKKIVKLVDTILDLSKRLQNNLVNSDKGNNIKKEIERIDKEINQKVYELYGLTEEEIKVIEESK